ncbi:hypothetical protein VP01_3309g3, partial [Puccinia sorghi]
SKESKTHPNKKLEQTRSTNMDKINSTILKTTIKAIPILTEENFSSWRTRINALFKLITITPQSVLLSYQNSRRPLNATSSHLITRTMPRFFGRPFLNDLSHPNPPIKHECIISLLAFNSILVISKILLRKFAAPSQKCKISLENIKQSITHSRNGEDIKPESLLRHLEIHINELKVSSTSKGETIGTTMFTSDNEKFSPGQHNPYSKTHTRDKCWSLFPEKHVAFLKKKEERQCSFLILDDLLTWSLIATFSHI